MKSSLIAFVVFTAFLANGVVATAVLPGRVAEAAAPAPKTPSTANTYTVQDGDTLLGIGAKLGISDDQLSDWVSAVVTLNNVGSPDKLALGQVLDLPAPIPSDGSTYTVADGDTLLGIASKVGVPVDQQLGWIASVVTLNGLGSPDQLSSGQLLNLPGSTPAIEPAADTSAPVTPPPPTASSQPDAGPPADASASQFTLLGSATPYSDTLVGRPLGCQGAGNYDKNDVTVIAVSPAQYSQFPCNVRLAICGSAGCITAVRKDSCPGCSPLQFDLSRSGFDAVCGAGANSCAIRISRLP